MSNCRRDEKCAELLDSIPDFSGLYERLTSAQVQDVLDAYMEGGSDDSGGDTQKFGSSTEKTSVDGALDDLM